MDLSKKYHFYNLDGSYIRSVDRWVVNRLDETAFFVCYTHYNGKHTEYVKNGKRHREDGPAVIHTTIGGREVNSSYWLNNKYIGMTRDMTPESFGLLVNLVKLKKIEY